MKKIGFKNSGPNTVYFDKGYYAELDVALEETRSE